MSFGRTEIARPSRFLEDIPSELLREVDVFGQDLASSARPRAFGRATWRPPAFPAGPPNRAGGAGDAPGASFRGGEKVRHPKFGVGTVVGITGEGARAEVTVVFDRAGAKRLLVKYANLEAT
jgi:DNA helicase-2/ATP-dependent DNA helicase PcrA